MKFNITKEEDWRMNRACAGVNTSVFFPLKITSSTISQAMSYCKNCSVRAECIQTAVIYGYDGIWGGSTMAQRNYLIKNEFNNITENFTLSDAKKMLQHISFVSVTIRSGRRKKLTSS